MSKNAAQQNVKTFKSLMLWRYPTAISLDAVPKATGTGFDSQYFHRQNPDSEGQPYYGTVNVTRS